MGKYGKWFHRVTSMALATLLLTVYGVGCTKAPTSSSTAAGSSVSSQTESKPYFNATGLPIVNEPITLKILTQDNVGSTAFTKAGDAPVWDILTEKTGIKFEVESYSPEDLSTKLSLIMADPDSMPDIFWQSTLTEEQTESYGSQGLLLEMTDLIEQYGENIKSIWNKNSTNRGYCTSTNGSVYSLVSYNEEMNPWTIMINDRWMKNCGITSYPTNLDELKEVLIKFRDMDANGNGDPKDEVPLIGNTTSLFQVLACSLGMMCDWPWTGCVYGSDAGSTKTYPLFMEERYKYLVSYYADLYAEKLINQDMFTISNDESDAIRLNDRMGAVANMQFPTAEEKYNPDDFTAIPLLTSKYLEKPIAFAGPSYQVCMAAANAKTKYPEAVVRFFDYCMSVDGTALFTVNSTIDYEASGVSQDIINAIKPYAAVDGGQNNFLATYGCRYVGGLTAKTGEFANNIKKTIFENLTEPYVRKNNFTVNYTYTLKFSSEENEIIAQYKSDIDTYVVDRLNSWIAGKSDVEKEWDGYITKLKAMHVDDLTKIYQAAVNRYYGVN